MLRVFSIEIDSDTDEYDLLEVLDHLATKVEEVSERYAVKVEESGDLIFSVYGSRS